MKVNLTYTCSRLRDLQFVRSEKTRALEMAIKNLPTLSSMSSDQRAGYVYCCNQKSKLEKDVQFYDRLLVQVRRTQGILDVLFNDFAKGFLEVNKANGMTTTDESARAAVRKAASIRLKCVGPIAGSIKHYLSSAERIRSWSGHSPEQGWQGSLDRFVELAAQPDADVETLKDLLLDAVWKQNLECKAVEFKLNEANSGLNAVCKSISIYEISKAEAGLEYNAANERLHRFLDLRVAEKKAWKSFEEALFRSA